jgi:ribonuclease VapC
MFLDASAIIAILAQESEASALTTRLSGAAKVYVSPLSLYEAVLGLARKENFAVMDAQRVVAHFVGEVRAETIAIDDAIGSLAIAAFERFGKGRHPASLNLGDCFAYACAKQLDAPLLCKGDDFKRTDIAIG